MGVQPIPDIQMTRYKISNGARFILSDLYLADLQTEKITQSLLAGDIEQVLDELKMLVRQRASMMIVECVPSKEIAKIPTAIGESSRHIEAEIAIARAKVREREQERPSRG
jgi:hypothetical protein